LIQLASSLKRQATGILADLHELKEPVLIAGHGQLFACLVDGNDFEFMQNRMHIIEMWLGVKWLLW